LTAATHWHDGQISKMLSSFICRLDGFFLPSAIDE
jgi:hypothetical protein